MPKSTKLHTNKAPSSFLNMNTKISNKILAANFSKRKNRGSSYLSRVFFMGVYGWFNIRKSTNIC